jgi:hypothetical protein
VIEALNDGGILTAICGLMLAAGLTGFGMGWSGGARCERRREARRVARINAALDGKLREVGTVTGPALYARTRGEPFTQVLRRHERDARRDRV